MMSKCTKELVDEWSKNIASARGGRCEIQLTKYMDKLTVDIILRSEFGMSDGKLGKELFEDLWMPGSRYTYKFPEHFLHSVYKRFCFKIETKQD